MRRHTSFISQAEPIFRYLSKSGGIIDGSAWSDMLEAISAELPTQAEPPTEQPAAFEP